MKVLNLYAGIGGNRKLWQDVEVTAVEHNEEIAAIYQDYFPNDKVIVTDAHEYLLKHYKEFDFIWSSPPCQSHSRLNTFRSGKKENIKYAKLFYPDMKLYQEIIFLNKWFYGKYVVENVIPYYEPLVRPTIELDRHFFWTNFNIRRYQVDTQGRIHEEITGSTVLYEYDLKNFKVNLDKSQLLRNMVNPDLGLYILEQARGIIRENNVSQPCLFN